MKLKSSRAEQVAKNTVKGTESAVRRLEAWYNDRYGKKLVLSSINKTNASFPGSIHDARLLRLSGICDLPRNELKRFISTYQEWLMELLRSMLGRQRA